MRDPVREAAARARAMSSGDAAHDWSHTERVVRNVRAICRSEGAPERLAVYAALFHDVVSDKSGPPGRDAALSAEAARGVLGGLGVPGPDVEVVAGAVRDHSYSAGREPGSAEGRMLQDADRLDALGAVGIARAFATGGALGRPLYSPCDPFCSSREPDGSAWTLDHFYSKLMALGRSMHTEYGRSEAARRVRVMERYVGDLRSEI